ncbi:pyridoxal-phosphate-dependent aminotransferase family protein [Desulfovermiculus halophilus]|jgi:aspartate aminotransferase-like enzyme|uniref:pyridoxal-phosphate-dependent aminotransferase family protein n=1 Tax=Desulfovermiculus halophilus TaxID=339722 RepID=UPI0004847F0F|nr:alanine--glyoxylate aminotransferase family protein [Desulfovermiculus halophilus]
MLNKQRLLTPGPTHLPEEVRLALSRDMIHHRKDTFVRLMGRIQPRLQTLFATREPVLPLSCSGTGAMQAAVDNLFAPGDRVLVVDGGKFGQRWVQIGEQNGLQVQRLSVPRGRAVDPDDVRAALDKDPELRGVMVQYSETSTGVLHPVRDLGRVVDGTQALLVVDGISGVGISPCPMDDWAIDCLLTGSQKGLMLPPGLALISLSAKAWDRVNSLPGTSFYFDLAKERSKWEQQQTAYTSPVNLILGLEASLNHLLAPDLEPVFRKQWALTRMTRAGVQALGLEPLARTHYTWGLTSFMMPAGIDAQKVLQQMSSEFNLVLAGGQDELKGRIIRLGHMGHVDWGDILAGLAALAHCLGPDKPDSGHKDALEQAMTAYTQALADDRPAVDKLLSTMQ